MTKLGKLWTDSVAYVALLTGAGLSIAGNVANVFRTRGALVDSLDVVLAVAFPALVVLMVEVFVSSRWRGLIWPMQVLRWLGTLSIGAVAMRVSWTHLHDLMEARGQKDDVANFGPLAIDALAIMATALILAGRGQAMNVANMDRPATLLDKLHERQQHTVDNWNNDLASASQPMDPAWTAEDEAMLASFERDMDRLELAKPLSAPPALARSNEIKPESVPTEAAELVRAWLATSAKARPLGKDRDVLLATHFGVSPRAARRWYEALAKVTN
jgi:hypothetical protein